MDSNHRRRSRRFYSTLLLPEADAADQRIRRSRRVYGPPPSAMRPWAPGSGGHGGHGRGQDEPRTRAERATDGAGRIHGRAQWELVTLTAPARLCSSDAAAITLFARFALGPGVQGAANGDEVANADISGTRAEHERNLSANPLCPVLVPDRGAEPAGLTCVPDGRCPTCPRCRSQ